MSLAILLLCAFDGSFYRWSNDAHRLVPPGSALFLFCYFLIFYWFRSLRIPPLISSFRQTSIWILNESRTTLSLLGSLVFYRKHAFSAQGPLGAILEAGCHRKQVKQMNFFPKSFSRLCPGRLWRVRAILSWPLFFTQCLTVHQLISLTSTFPGQSDICAFCPAAAENTFQSLRTIPLQCPSLVSFRQIS